MSKIRRGINKTPTIQSAPKYNKKVFFLKSQTRLEFEQNK